MEKNINFVKITAAGNDFVMIDNRTGKNSLSPSLIKKICDRKFGVGADGVIFLEKSHHKQADFRMKYFNSDGSRASMCGNGARSIVRFAELVGATAKDKGFFISDAGLIGYEFIKKGNLIKVELTKPHSPRVDFQINVGGKRMNVSFINTGVPHTVVFSNDNKVILGIKKNISFDEIDICALGRAIRFHKEFAPAGTNVNFVEVINRSTIKVRTYERGVEDETLACGTGVTASAIISGMKKFVTPPVKVLTRGGEILEVDYNLFYQNPSSSVIPQIKDVHLKGPARVVFEGHISV